MNSNWTIEFLPLIPLSFLAALAVISALLGIYLLRLGRRGTWLRSLSLAMIMVALLNPNIIQEQRQNLNNIVLIVVDESLSQKIADRDKMTQALRKALQAKLSKIPDLDIKWMSSGHHASGGQEGTTLFSDLNQELSTLATHRLAAIIMMTDGQIHDPPSKLTEIDPNIPIHALITGQKEERDRRIEVLKAPRFGLKGSEGIISIRVLDEGLTSASFAQGVVLTIKREGREAEKRRVEIGKAVEISLPFPRVGPNIVEIEVETASPHELTLANNQIAISSEGIRENLRVLLVSGEPHAGERTWRNLLKSDAAVDLVHFIILRPPEKQDGTPTHQLSLIAFPTHELFSEKLDQFDLIIFDRYQRRGVLPTLYLDNVAQYVKKGGAVLVAAGESYAGLRSLFLTPLSRVLPATPTGKIIETPYRAMVTDRGRKHPVTRGLAGGGSGGPPDWGRWFRLIVADHPRGQILMSGPSRHPLLILDRIGEGRVALLLSDHAWLWARGFDGGGPYSDLLRRLAHWLMKEPDLEEEFLRATGEGHSLLIERRSIKEKVENVEITAPDGKTRSLFLRKGEPGLWSRRVEISDPGLYRLKSGSLTALAHIGALNVRELRQVTATDKKVRPIVEKTAGGIYWMAAKEGELSPKTLPRIRLLRSARIMSGADWLGLRDRQAFTVEGVKLIPLFTGFLALALLFALIGLTWFREGQ